MINLKILLAKILADIHTLTKNQYQHDWAYTWTNGPLAQSDYRVRKYFYDFNGCHTDYFNTNSNYIGINSTNPSGFSIYKSGWYIFDCCGHMNCTAGVRIEIDILKFTWSGDESPTLIAQKYFFDNNLTWLPVHVRTAVYLESGNIIAPAFQKYTPNNTTSTFQTSSISMSLIRIGD